MAEVDLGVEKNKVVSLDGIEFDLVVHRYSDGRVFASMRAKDLVTQTISEWTSVKIEERT